MNLVSVIIPVYNVEPYLRQCLDSVLNQTYKDIEIIIIDDGSTDHSGEICDKYLKYDNRVIVIHKNNEGLGMARNTGLGLAQGDYVYFLDSDDYIDEDEIRILYEYAHENNLDACFEGYMSVNDRGNFIRAVEYENCIYSGRDLYKTVFTKMLGSLPNGTDRIEMSAATQLYSMKIINEYHIRFVSERTYVSEDLIWNKEILSKSNRVGTVKWKGSYYRYNPTSLSHQYRENRFEQTIDFYVYVKKMLINEGFSEEALFRHTKTFFVGLRSCIKQERYSQVNIRFIDKIKAVRIICNNKVVREAISINGIKRMGLKQKLYILLIKHRASSILLSLS